MKSTLFLLLYCLIATVSYGQTISDSNVHKGGEPPVAEIGLSLSKSIHGGNYSYGPNIGIEFTPIDNWLEIEADLTPLISNHNTEWTFDLLLKKPFTLTRKLEFMAGLGPELSYSKADHTVLGLELAGDFMYWPAKRRKFGIYLEPAYDIDFVKENSPSFGCSGGLLISFK